MTEETVELVEDEYLVPDEADPEDVPNVPNDEVPEEVPDAVR
jgi:hypothetical protein